MTCQAALLVRERGDEDEPVGLGDLAIDPLAPYHFSIWRFQCVVIHAARPEIVLRMHDLHASGTEPLLQTIGLGPHFPLQVPRCIACTADVEWSVLVLCGHSHHRFTAS